MDISSCAIEETEWEGGLARPIFYGALLGTLVGCVLWALIYYGGARLYADDVPTKTQQRVQGRF